MKAIVRIWGDGSYFNVGSIPTPDGCEKIAPSLEELKAQADSGGWDRSVFGDARNADVESVFGINPSEARLLVVEERPDGEETVFDAPLTSIPQKCFVHKFRAVGRNGSYPAHIWRYQHTVYADWFWNEITMKSNEKFDPEDLIVTVEHCLIRSDKYPGVEEVFCRIIEVEYDPLPDEDFWQFDDEDGVDWGAFYRLDVF